MGVPIAFAKGTPKMTQAPRQSALQKAILARLRGCTQTALAAELGVSQGTISYLHSGKLTSVSLATRRHVAAQLGLHIYERGPRATIQFRPETRARLAARKLEGESFDTVIVRLLNIADLFKEAL
jgi:transcriptional regulator with XRE-family HTH domain